MALIQALKRHPVLTYFVLVYVLSWACWIPLAIAKTWASFPFIVLEDIPEPWPERVGWSGGNSSVDTRGPREPMDISSPPGLAGSGWLGQSHQNDQHRSGTIPSASTPSVPVPCTSRSGQ